jgi:hypothetical protein
MAGLAGKGDRCPRDRHGVVSAGSRRARCLMLALGLGSLGFVSGTAAVGRCAMRPAQLTIQRAFPIFQFFSNYQADPNLQNTKMVIPDLQKFPTLRWW